MPLIIYFITLVALLVDSYGSGTTIMKYLFISAQTIAIASIILFTLLRIWQSPILSTFWLKINTLVMIILLPVSIILSIAGYVLPANTVYAATKIQYTNLFLAGLYAGFVWLLSKPNTWFSRHYESLVFASAPVLLGLGIIVYTFPFSVFVKLTEEDQLVENLQVGALIIASIGSAIVAKYLFTHKKQLLSAIFIACCIVLLFVSGDEIAWGQRFFNVLTPAYLSEINAQNEITFHNINAVGGFVSIGYIFLGLYGATAWIFKKSFSYFVPPWYTAPYFFLGFIYNFYISLGDHQVGEWSEFVELMLYFGIMFYIIHLVRQLKHSRSS